MLAYTPKWPWLWSRDCFKILPFAVMQSVARVCQQSLTNPRDV